MFFEHQQVRNSKLMCNLCAGIVFSIAYTHTPRQGPGHVAPATASPATLGSQYQLVVAVTRIKGLCWGEGFRDFMRSETVRRISLMCYLDLFLYQAPALRYVLFCAFAPRSTPSLLVVFLYQTPSPWDANVLRPFSPPPPPLGSVSFEQLLLCGLRNIILSAT
jgi:hypothetical protein